MSTTSEPPPASAIVARYRYTVDEYLTAVRLSVDLRRARMTHGLIPVSWKPYLLVALVVIGILISIVDVVTGIGYRQFAGPVIIGLAIFIFLLEKLFLPALWRAAFNKSAIRDAEIEWRLAPDLLASASTNPTSKSEFSWRMIIRAGVGANGILLFPNRVTFFWLPKSAFANEAEFLRAVEWVKSNVKDTTFIK